MSRQSANGQAPADWAAAQYQPGPAVPLLRCTCGAAWLDDEPGRHAHRVVFLHEPRPGEPASPPPAQEGPDHAST